MFRILGCFSLILQIQTAQAVCSSPSGKAGEFAYDSGSTQVRYCNNTSWIDTTQSVLVSCSGTTAGTINYSSGTYRYCNGTNWISMKGSSLGSCSGTTAGTLTYDTSALKLKFCDGTNWYDTTKDLCTGTPAVGTACAGGAIYAGTFNSGKYMVTPGGCTDSATPTCSGTDAVAKTWGTLGTTTGLTSTTDGGTNTGTLSGSYADTFAAKFCANMVYGGYSDWFLPAKDELNFLYTSRASTGGFAASSYWASTEGSSDNYAYSQNFSLGGATAELKSDSRLVRCVRRY